MSGERVGNGVELVLYLVFDSTLQRVPIKKGGFSSMACYLLMVPERPGSIGGSGASQSTLFTWIGVRSMVRDRSSADELATKIIKNDLGSGWKQAPVVRESMVACSTSDEVMAFKASLLEAGIAPEEMSTSEEPNITSPRLATFNSSLSPPLQNVNRPGMGESGNLSSTFDPHLFRDRGGSALLLMTAYETFIYFPKMSDEAQKQAVTDWLDEQGAGESPRQELSFITVIEEGQEPTVFKTLFRDWDNFVGGNSSDVNLSVRTVPQGGIKVSATDSPVHRKQSSNRYSSSRRRSSVQVSHPVTSATSGSPVRYARSLKLSWRPTRPGTGKREDIYKATKSSTTSFSSPLLPISAAGIRMEVWRSMLDPTIGTPALMEMGVGDPNVSKNGRLLMSKARSGKALVRQWLVNPPFTSDVNGISSTEHEKLPTKRLTATEVPARRLGLVTSGDAYLIACDYVYLVVVEGAIEDADPVKKQKCAMSSEFCVETVVYLWLGRRYRYRDELRAMVKNDDVGNLLPDGIRAEGATAQYVMKVIVDQGREPPYLLALFANALGGFVVLNGLCCVPRANGKTKDDHQVASRNEDSHRRGLEVLDPSVRVIEISEVPIYPFLQSGGLIATELDPAVARCGLHPHKTYLILEGANHHNRSFETLWVKHSPSETPQLRRFINSLSNYPRCLFLPGRRSKAPSGLMRGYVNHIHPDLPPPDAMWEALGLGGEGSGAKLLVQLDVPLLRAMRLWRVNYKAAKKAARNISTIEEERQQHISNRNNNAIHSEDGECPWSAYIQEVGPLCSFSQDDLVNDLSCILDPGCDVVFVWHGSRASTKMRELAVRAAKVYTASVAVGALDKSAMVLTLIQVDEGSEPPELGACFCGWGGGGASVDTASETSALEGFPSSDVNVDGVTRDRLDQLPSVKRVIDPYELEEEDEKDISSCVTHAVDKENVAVESTKPVGATSTSSHSSKVISTSEDEEEDEFSDLWSQIDISVSRIFGGAVTAYNGEEVAYEVQVKNTFPHKAQTWTCNRQLLDFRGLELLLDPIARRGAIKRGGPLPLKQFEPTSHHLGTKKYEDSQNSVAKSIETWFRGLLSLGSALPLRSRFRVHSFLCVRQNLKELSEAADVEWEQHVDVGLACNSCLEFIDALPRTGLYGTVADVVVEIRDALRSEEATLKYRIEEMQSRASYAASHEEQIRDKLATLRQDGDDLLKQRRTFRNDMYTIVQSMDERGSAVGGGVKHASEFRKQKNRDAYGNEERQRGGLGQTAHDKDSNNSPAPPYESSDTVRLPQSSGSVKGSGGKHKKDKGVWKKLSSVFGSESKKSKNKTTTRDNNSPPSLDSTHVTVNSGSQFGGQEIGGGTISPSESRTSSDMAYNAKDGKILKANLDKVELAYAALMRKRDKLVSKANLAQSIQMEAEARLANYNMAMARLLHLCDQRIDRVLLNAVEQATWNVC